MHTNKHTVLSLNHVGFINYLILTYLIEKRSDERWTYLSRIPEYTIPSNVIYQLYLQLKSDLQLSGGSVVAYRPENSRLKSYKDLKSEVWSDNWMWVIKG